MEKISRSMKENQVTVQLLCAGCDDIIVRPMRLGVKEQVDCLVVYIESAVSNMMLEDSVIGKLLNHLWELDEEEIRRAVEENGLGISDVKELETMEECMAALLAGNAIFFLDGYERALKIGSKGYPDMGVVKADSEKVLRGSKEAFSESAKVNTALVRKRIRTTDLKVEELFVGQQSNTLIALVYMENLAYPNLLAEIKERIGKVPIDSVLDSGIVEQLTADTWYSPFPQFQTTERPDRAAAAVLEGRILLLCDNTPVSLLLPTTMNSLLQTGDDYYGHFEIASLLRCLRYLAVFLAFSLPGLYLAVTGYHPQILPTPIGDMIGIVGGLIIGQAAVTANLISPIIVIIDALTALGSFSIPNEELSEAFRLLKYGMIFLCGFFGLYGFVMGWLLLLIHLAGLRSFGIPYLMPFAAVGKDGISRWTDGLLRAPMRRLNRRPVYARRERRKK